MANEALGFFSGLAQGLGRSADLYLANLLSGRRERRREDFDREQNELKMLMQRDQAIIKQRTDMAEMLLDMSMNNMLDPKVQEAYRNQAMSILQQNLMANSIVKLGHGLIGTEFEKEATKDPVERLFGGAGFEGLGERKEEKQKEKREKELPLFKKPQAIIPEQTPDKESSVADVLAGKKVRRPKVESLGNILAEALVDPEEARRRASFQTPENRMKGALREADPTNVARLADEFGITVTTKNKTKKEIIDEIARVVLKMTPERAEQFYAALLNIRKQGDAEALTLEELLPVIKDVFERVRQEQKKFPLAVSRFSPYR